MWAHYRLLIQAVAWQRCHKHHPQCRLWATGQDGLSQSLQPVIQIFYLVVSVLSMALLKEEMQLGLCKEGTEVLHSTNKCPTLCSKCLQTKIPQRSSQARGTWTFGQCFLLNLPNSTALGCARAARLRRWGARQGREVGNSMAHLGREEMFKEPVEGTGGRLGEEKVGLPTLTCR